jgi:hypothetical protein
MMIMTERTFLGHNSVLDVNVIRNVFIDDRVFNNVMHVPSLKINLLSKPKL